MSSKMVFFLKNNYKSLMKNLTPFSPLHPDSYREREDGGEGLTSWGRRQG